MIKQISVFVENKKGRLSAMTKVLSDNNIDLIALSIADTTNFGILRCIVDKIQKALEVLSDAGFAANTTDVIAVKVEDKPGGLTKVLDILTAADVSVEYLYSFVKKTEDGALIIFRVDNTKKTIDVFTENNITMLTEEEIGILS